MVKQPEAKPELIPSYPDHQPWRSPVKVEWINRSEPHLTVAGLVALGFWNGAVFLAPADQGIQVGDSVTITEVSFQRSGEKSSHSTFIVSQIK